MTAILVAKSDAIAPLSVEAARFLLAAARARTARIEILATDFEIVVQPYSLIKLRNRPMSPAAQSVYDFIRNEAIARRA